MRETIDVSGVVLYAQPIGEFDKRLVILTRELGKITVFAHGARRQNSAFLAIANPFVFAAFHILEGKNSYSLAGADVVEYFTDLSMKQPGVWYGFYFMELASYYGREGIESSNMVNLIYLALKAILHELMPLSLIRRVYELRMMVENGDFAVPDSPNGMDQSAWYALRFCASQPLTRIFAFRLTDEAEADFTRSVKKQLKRCVDRPMKSLQVIEEVT